MTELTEFGCKNYFQDQIQQLQNTLNRIPLWNNDNSLSIESNYLNSLCIDKRLIMITNTYVALIPFGSTTRSKMQELFSKSNSATSKRYINWKPPWNNDFHCTAFGSTPTPLRSWIYKMPLFLTTSENYKSTFCTTFSPSFLNLKPLLPWTINISAKEINPQKIWNQYAWGAELRYTNLASEANKKIIRLPHS